VSERPIVRTLKEGLHRTVRLEFWEEGGTVRGRVVKRFHGAGAVRRLFDRWRARRELRALCAMRRAGLPVPLALGLARSGGAWELATELVPDALPLRLAIESFAPWPAAPEVLARRLGRLFARVLATGLDHADPHPDNVLVDAAGEPWLIDLGKSRVRSGTNARRIERELVRVAAGVREHVGPAFRLRFLLAFLRALPGELRGELPAPRELARRTERGARHERREVLRRARLRWTRQSSAARPFREGAYAGYLRRELPDELPGLVLGDALPSAARGAFEMPFPGEGSRALVGHCGRDFGELRERWYSAARLAMHGVPCAEPVLLARGPRSVALFELPAGARPLAALAEGARGPARRRLAHALGELLGTLHDRGLSVRKLAARELWVTPAGKLLLGPVAALQALSPAGRSDAWRGLSAASFAAPVAGRGERAAFAAAYVAAHRGGRAERLALRRELRGG